MEFLKAFIFGGLICVVGQILIDKTKMTPGRILVLFVVLGCILGGVGVYSRFAEFAGAGVFVKFRETYRRICKEFTRAFTEKRDNFRD